MVGKDQILDRLIFGTAGFDLGRSERTHLRCLEHVWNEGIRRFDTAPIYCHGRSERILGKFIRKKKHSVVQTKCGLTCRELPYLPAWLFRGLKAAHRLKSNSRGRKKTLPQVNSSSLSPPMDLPKDLPKDLQPKQLSLSVDRSRRKLGLDTLPGLLLHEVHPDHANNPLLRDWMLDSISNQSVQRVGIAGTNFPVDKIEIEKPYSILQSEYFLGASKWPQVASRETHLSTIAYSAFRTLPMLLAGLQEKKLRRSLTEAIDSDLSGLESPAVWLASWVLQKLPTSKLIFYSSKELNISEIASGVPHLLNDPDRIDAFGKAALELLGDAQG